MSVRIALVGATGNVGRKVACMLLERGIVHPRQLSLFASSRSHGKTLAVGPYVFEIRSTESIDFSQYTVCIFNTEQEISQIYAPFARQTGCYIVDSSSFYRLDTDVPLIVPPVNGSSIKTSTSKLYAHSNCLVSPIATVIAPLHSVFPIERVNAVTYQSTSGAGKHPCDECWEETKAVVQHMSFKREYFKRQIAFNVIPQVGTIQEDGMTSEEFKIIHELKKVIHPHLRITATSVRVPVMVGHSIALSLEFQSNISLKEIAKILEAAPCVRYIGTDYRTPVEIVGSDDVWVGRVRKDPSSDHGIHLWLCSDNLRRGAATDCVEIVDLILRAHF